MDFVSLYIQTYHSLLRLTRPENVKMHLQKNADGCFVKKVISLITLFIQILLNNNCLLLETDTIHWIDQLAVLF